MAAASEADDDVVVVLDPHANVDADSEESVHEEGVVAGGWRLVRSRLAAAATTIQQPMTFSIGSDRDSESIVGDLQVPPVCVLPCWAVISMIGLAAAVLLQQERRIAASERRYAELAQLLSRALAQQAEASTTQQGLAQSMALQQRDTGLLGCALGLGGALLLLSDERLKRDVRRLPGLLGPCPLYSWRWSDEADARFSLRGSSFGVLAQEVARLRPEAVRQGQDGFLRVDYGMLLS